MIKKLFILTILCITHSLCFAINKVTSITIDQLEYEVISSLDRTVSVSSIPSGCSGDITIPSTVEIGGVTHTVTTIGELAFFECKRLTSVNIPNSVTSIGEDAFGESFRLKSVNIPKSVSHIGANAFYGCSGLTEVYYGAENPIEIDYDIFSDYSKPTLYVPEVAMEKCKQISPWMYFSKIEAYNFADIEDNDDNSQLLFQIISLSEKTASVAADPNGCSGDIIIPSIVEIGGVIYTVTTIGERAFDKCNGLTSVTIPHSITSIGKQAFYYCSALTSINIPYSVASIGDYAFDGCGNLKSIKVDYNNKNYSDFDGVLYNKNFTELIICPEAKTSVAIPSSVTSIAESAFDKCRYLTSVIIPNSVTSIGDYAFSRCVRLISVTIPDSVTSISEGVFSECSSLLTVTIPSSVTTIGREAFDECSSLLSVTIPESVTSIGVYAFMGCSRLTAVAIPSSVTEIGYAAFCRCYDLTEVYYGAENPIEIGYDIFSDYSKPTLYVPEVAVEKCKQISPWMYFSKIEAYNFAGIDEITVDIDSEKSYEVYNLNGIALGNSTDNLTKGIYIIRQGSTVKKITVK